MSRSMDECRQSLRIAAYLMSYPDAAWREGLAEVERMLKSSQAGPASSALQTFLHTASQADAHLFEASYVSSFDFGKDTSLYATSRNRADEAQQRVDLISYSTYFVEAGYEVDGETPDYLPALLELAAATKDEETKRILQGMRVNVEALRDALAAGGLDGYAGLIESVLSIAQACEQEVA